MPLLVYFCRTKNEQAWLALALARPGAPDNAETAFGLFRPSNGLLRVDLPLRSLTAHLLFLSPPLYYKGITSRLSYQSNFQSVSA